MSAISGPAQENLHFYAKVLGLRLVKLTVNFDDPSAYHLYYGDGLGNPGTLLTFFPYPGGRPGRPGAGQTTVTHLSIPKGAMAYWVNRFKQFDVDFDRPTSKDGRDAVRFRAPDGLLLELVATSDYIEPAPWTKWTVPHDKAIGGIHSFTLVEREIGPTRAVLEKDLGFKLVSENGGRFRFEVGRGGPQKTVDVLVDPDGPSGREGHGSVHHIAFRTPTSESQANRRQILLDHGFRVSPVKDRDYFQSIYFREPGGVLFEIATDKPGFQVDEPEPELGSALQLPQQFSDIRAQIEKALPKLELV